jgi:dihydrofolate reductase
MAELFYSAIASADGYVEDAARSFDWAAPDEELHRFVNDLERPVGTYLYGRRMYETMLYWETAHTVPGQPSFVREFTGIWQAAEKIVFSKTLQSVSSARTRIERNFDPDMVRQLKSATGHDMTVGGADLAGQAIKARLVDELQLFLVPIVVGGGKRALPNGVRSDLNYWTRSGSQAESSTSGTVPGQRDHLTGCRTPIGAPGLATPTVTRPGVPPTQLRSPRSVSPETTPSDPRWPTISANIGR